MQDKEGVPPHAYRVTLEGRTLEDTDSVSSSAISKDSCLHMMLRLAGGSTGNLGSLLLGETSDRTLIQISAFREGKLPLRIPL